MMNAGDYLKDLIKPLHFFLIPYVSAATAEFYAELENKNI